MNYFLLFALYPLLCHSIHSYGFSAPPSEATTVLHAEVSIQTCPLKSDVSFTHPFCPPTSDSLTSFFSILLTSYSLLFSLISDLRSPTSVFPACPALRWSVLSHRLINLAELLNKNEAITPSLINPTFFNCKSSILE